MALFMDLHRDIDGLTAEGVAQAHQADLDVQQRYGVSYLRYWFNEEMGTVYCLVEAPDADTAVRVHREAHGLLADEITRVKEGM